MIITNIAQPDRQLGYEISELLDSDENHTRIAFVSAFVALRTVLRLREQLLRKVEDGADLRFTVGIDLGGTSREVLEELLRWDCETYVFHNTVPRATFHPKAYLFETTTRATLFVGSNNLTDGGFYTNYEAATRYDFDLPADTEEYERLVGPLNVFFYPRGATVRQLNAPLIKTLVDRGELPSEAEARERNRDRNRRRAGEIPDSPFSAVATPLPPLLPESIRPEEPDNPDAPEPPQDPEVRPVESRPDGVLVWRKVLPRSDALQVNDGTAHVGGVRLTQARFVDTSGYRIDQTTYFRRLFADYHWEREIGRKREADQEHAFVPMRIFIHGVDYGVRNFEISHKPSGEAAQDNYTTILRWGRDLTPTIQGQDLTGSVLSLYETPGEETAFLIDVSGPPQ